MNNNTVLRSYDDSEERGTISQRWLLAVFLVVYFVVLCVLSLKVPLAKDFFPDEKGRIALPWYFYEHGALPTGYEESVRMSPWGFSYASYPLMLSTVLGGSLMKLTGLVTSNPDWIVFSARLVSIVSGTVFAYFVIQISFMLFKRPFSYLFASLVIFLPQIIFCSLYFNNDIVALCGSSLILYAWLSGMRDTWSMRSAIILALGISIIALSYYNAYSWILLSLFVYFFSWHRAQDSIGSMLSEKRFLRTTLLIAGIVLVLTMPFFIRAAIINHGDFLGLSTVSRMSEQYGAEGFSPSTRPTPKHLGMSLWEMLTTTHYLGEGNTWLLSTYRSFIGVFGPLSVFLPRIVYMLYGIAFIVGTAGYIIGTATKIKTKTYGKRILFDVAMLINIAIVVSLALQYSYATDYQAQGRYILPMILSFAYLVVQGWTYTIESILKRVTDQYLLCGILVGISGCIAVIAFAAYYSPAV